MSYEIKICGRNFQLSMANFQSSPNLVNFQFDNLKIENFIFSII